MTVQDLIDRLQKVDPNKEVVVQKTSSYCTKRITDLHESIRTVEIVYKES